MQSKLSYDITIVSNILPVDWLRLLKICEPRYVSVVFFFILCKSLESLKIQMLIKIYDIKTTENGGTLKWIELFHYMYIDCNNWL